MLTTMTKMMIIMTKMARVLTTLIKLMMITIMMERVLTTLIKIEASSPTISCCCLPLSPLRSVEVFSDKCPTNDFLSPCKVIHPGEHPDHQEADYGDLQQGGWVTWIVPGGSCHPLPLCKVARGFIYLARLKRAE